MNTDKNFNMQRIVTAYTEGKKIEFRKRTDSFCKSYVWQELKEPNFNFVENEYRIFTEPSYMKLGRDELEMLRRDYKWLIENHTKVELATAKIGYNIFQINDLIDAMSDMKSFIINQMPLKEAYKEELDAYKAKYGDLNREENNECE